MSQLYNDEESMVKEKLPLDFSILGWCFALSFAPQVLFSFFVSVTLAINGLNVWENEDPQIEVMIMLGTSILSPLLFFPLIKFVSGSKSFHELLTYVNFKSIKLTMVNSYFYRFIGIFFRLFILLTRCTCRLFHT